jgi:hypothetical protein
MFSPKSNFQTTLPVPAFNAYNVCLLSLKKTLPLNNAAEDSIA